MEVEARCQLEFKFKLFFSTVLKWETLSGEVAAAVKHALAKGYRSVDCAAVYGNEAEVGEGLREGMKEAGIKREEVFVTSKLWNTFHHADDVEAACKKTLGDLGLEYLDLYLIHWPTAFKRGEGTLFPKNEDGTVKVLVEAVQYTYFFPSFS